MSTAYQRAPDELVANTMTTRLLTCAPTTTLVEAAHIMAERRVGAILVTEGDRLMGILTERDVLRTVGGGSIEGTVSDQMTVVEDDRLVGIVSIRDLLRLPNESPAGV
jgi:CBS domain-containing protein